MNNLEEIKAKINICDDIIIEQLVNRMNLIKEIIDYKKKHSIPILQPDQEKKQRKVLNEKLDNNQFEEEILDIFTYIIKNSKKIQAKSLFSYNIMLVGFMGSGKSTVSAYLSRLLAMEEVEVDALICKKEGMSISQIFEKHGETYFRNIESNILIELQNKNQAIVSCGGGVVLREENIIHMKKHGRVVLLTASPETILERVKDSDERPILNNNKNTTFISDLMDKRKEKYMSAADIIVNTDGKSIQEVCEEVIIQLIHFGNTSK